MTKHNQTLKTIALLLTLTFPCLPAGRCVVEVGYARSVQTQNLASRLPSQGAELPLEPTDLEPDANLLEWQQTFENIIMNTRPRRRKRKLSKLFAEIKKEAFKYKFTAAVHTDEMMTDILTWHQSNYRDAESGQVIDKRDVRDPEDRHILFAIALYLMIKAYDVRNTSKTGIPHFKTTDLQILEEMTQQYSEQEDIRFQLNLPSVLTLSISHIFDDFFGWVHLSDVISLLPPGIKEEVNAFRLFLNGVHLDLKGTDTYYDLKIISYDLLDTFLTLSEETDLSPEKRKRLEVGLLRSLTFLLPFLGGKGLIKINLPEDPKELQEYETTFRGLKNLIFILKEDFWELAKKYFPEKKYQGKDPIMAGWHNFYKFPEDFYYITLEELKKRNKELPKFPPFNEFLLDPTNRDSVAFQIFLETLKSLKQSYDVEVYSEAFAEERINLFFGILESVDDSWKADSPEEYEATGLDTEIDFMLFQSA